MTETCRSRTADRHLLKREKVRVRYFVCLDRSDRSRPHLRPRQQTSPTLYSDFGEYFCALQLPRRTLPLPCALQRLGYCSRHRLYILLYLRLGASKCAARTPSTEARRAISFSPPLGTSRVRPTQHAKRHTASIAQIHLSPYNCPILPRHTWLRRKRVCLSSRLSFLSAEKGVW